MLNIATEETGMKPNLGTQNKSDVTKSPIQQNLSYKPFEMSQGSAGTFKSAYAQQLAMKSQYENSG